MPFAVIACIGLFLLFPKGFKYLVGTWLGFMAGSVAWVIAALLFNVFFVPFAFAYFAMTGIFAGILLAMYG